MALAEVLHHLPNREAYLREVCSKITPSTTALYVKHLQAMYETFYNEYSLHGSILVFSIEVA